MSQETFENTLHAWAVKGSALDASRVLWASQENPFSRPDSSGPFVVLQILADVATGATAEEITEYDPDGEEGEEIIQTVREFAAVTLSVQVFGGSQTGNASAKQIAANMRLALSLPSVRLSFESAEFSCFDKGSIQDLTEVLDTTFEPRASFEPRFYVTRSQNERIGYIGTIQITDETISEMFEVELDS